MIRGRSTLRERNAPTCQDLLPGDRLRLPDGRVGHVIEVLGVAAVAVRHGWDWIHTDPADCVLLADLRPGVCGEQLSTGERLRVLKVRQAGSVPLLMVRALDDREGPDVVAGWGLLADDFTADTEHAAPALPVLPAVA